MAVLRGEDALMHRVAHAGFDDHLAVDPCDVVLDARLRRLHVGEVLLQLGTLLLHGVLQVSLHLGDGLLRIDDVALLLIHFAVLGAQVVLPCLQFIIFRDKIVLAGFQAIIFDDQIVVFGDQVILSCLQLVETSIDSFKPRVNVFEAFVYLLEPLVDLVEFLGYGCCECCNLL